MKTPTICFVAGKSGGHIIPCLTIAQTIRAQNDRTSVLFFSSDTDLDKKILDQNPAVSWHIMLPLSTKAQSLYKTVVHATISFMRSFFYLCKYRPQEIITTGGIVAIPTCIAGFILRIPITIYSLDAVPGKAIQFLIPFATSIYVCFESSQKYFPAGKSIVKPYPVKYSNDTIAKTNKQTRLKFLSCARPDPSTRLRSKHPPALRSFSVGRVEGYPRAHLENSNIFKKIKNSEKSARRYHFVPSFVSLRRGPRVKRIGTWGKAGSVRARRKYILLHPENALRNTNQQKTLIKLHLNPHKKTIVILGGSQGSLFLNNCIKELIKNRSFDREQYNIIHQTGSLDATDWKHFYQENNSTAYVFSYMPDLEYIYSAADLIICRAGAGTLFEIKHFNKSCIIIPLETNTTTHQVDNAQAMSKEYPELFYMIMQRDIEKNNNVLVETINTMLLKTNDLQLNLARKSKQN